MKESLIDDLYLFVNPVALGKGEWIFGSLKKWQGLMLKKSQAYKSGVMMLHYELRK